ncbi:unnamed protein product [Spirodela intermedia]|uniref:Uncharacterized protein n=1 Tax=Spirodela intermedia TaxID=51605 RepID=A0A7I8IXT3_SPIIN|nr:unnamed protein product [Spirodela intermedia]CAA6662667.1 unnamed protein product [Spirodela intermedia]
MPEWAIVELQGVVEADPSIGNQLQNLEIGSVYKFTVGYHELSGRRCQEEGGVAGGAESSTTELEVIGIIRHRILFKNRPKALISVPQTKEKKTASGTDEISDSCFSSKALKSVTCGLLAAWVVTTASPVVAANQRLPPLSTEPDRCERAFVGNTIGQANGVYDKPLDLRFCDYTNEKSNLKGKSLAAALMSGAKFDGADMTEVIMSKAYAVGASFKGKDDISHFSSYLSIKVFRSISCVDFSNAVLDRVNFGKADLHGAVFKNTVLSGSTFEEAQLQDVVFEDTIIGYIDLQKLCTNTTITADGRAELGCR